MYITPAENVKATERQRERGGEALLNGIHFAKVSPASLESFPGKESPRQGKVKLHNYTLNTACNGICNSRTSGLGYNIIVVKATIRSVAAGTSSC